MRQWLDCDEDRVYFLNEKDLFVCEQKPFGVQTTMATKWMAMEPLASAPIAGYWRWAFTSDGSNAMPWVLVDQTRVGHQSAERKVNAALGEDSKMASVNTSNITNITRRVTGQSGTSLNRVATRCNLSHCGWSSPWRHGSFARPEHSVIQSVIGPGTNDIGTNTTGVTAVTVTLAQ